MKQKYSVPNQKKLIFTGGVFISLGTLLLVTWPILMRFIISQGHIFTADSPTYQIWKKNIVPLSLDFYLFNWTNPQDIYNTSTKPIFTEIGPIKFTETKTKVNVTWNSNNTVSFKHLKMWQFDRNGSVVDLNTLITTVNAVSLSAGYQARHWSFWTKAGLQFALGQLAPRIDTTKTIRELLFEGYEDVFVTLGKNFNIGPTLPKMDKFGWFYGRNGSYDNEGYFNMDTTKENLGLLRKWNTLDHSPSYPLGCNKIDGAAGEFFKPEWLKEKLSIFTPDLCRSLTLDFDGEGEVNGINGLKYIVDISALDNGTKIPSNNCYCTGECVPSGVMNVSSCKYGSPGFVSLPHFYNADPYYLNAVEGMKPSKDKHEFYMIFEPTTGMPLSVGAKLQLNLLMQPIKNIRYFENLPRIFFPVLWFQQSVDIPDLFIMLLKLLLNLPLICQTLGFVFLLIGTSLIFYLVYKPILQYVQQKNMRFEKNFNIGNDMDVLNYSIIEQNEKCIIKKKEEEAMIE